MVWTGAPELGFGPPGRGPPGSGGKVQPVVKSLVLEWPGSDRGAPEADFGVLPALPWWPFSESTQKTAQSGCIESSGDHLESNFRAFAVCKTTAVH